MFFFFFAENDFSDNIKIGADELSVDRLINTSISSSNSKVKHVTSG